MASRLYLIRHGITEGNEKMWYYGKADLPLAPRGKEQLICHVEQGVYPKIKEDADYYTTGLLRTEETFQILFGQRSHKALNLLREMDFGDFECKSYENLKTHEEFNLWASDKTGNVKLPGGESRNQFASRISEGLKELLGYHRLKELSHRHSGADTVSVVVCHGGVISAIMELLFPEIEGNMWDWIPAPGLGYVVEIEQGNPRQYQKLIDPKASEGKTTEK